MLPTKRPVHYLQILGYLDEGRARTILESKCIIKKDEPLKLPILTVVVNEEDAMNRIRYLKDRDIFATYIVKYKRSWFK
jgi:hypothetical protein